ncbi:Activating signal cointegrator 1 [Quillaja saponaria]|uniref:Activating signal cointegrator 1 n=1 Tax=Quillaja saponaria TaxID=32244 RepID=A0AAD7QB11_QUISA|nr:Activating signal cointegrator 1 [Quillaja saponaria]
MRGRNSGNYTNPCLTMHQPWASLLVYGIKRIEGRSWPAPIRGRLWIHAASKVPDESTIKAMEDFYREIYAVNGFTNIKFPEHYPISRLLGCVEVVGCVKGEELASWEMVPEGVRLEGQTDYCWLCEQPQKLLVPFEMRGYQRVYNLERKIYEAAVRGLTSVESPLPVKFPLPNPRDPFSLKPGSIRILSPNPKTSEVDKSSSLSVAIAGARAAATQFTKKDNTFQTSIQISAGNSMGTVQSPSTTLEENKILSTYSNEISDQGFVASNSKDQHSNKKFVGSSKYNQPPGTDSTQQSQPPSKIFAAAMKGLKPS